MGLVSADGGLFAFCALATAAALRSTHGSERPRLAVAYVVSLVGTVVVITWVPFLWVPGWGERAAAPAALGCVGMAYALRASEAPARGLGDVDPSSPPRAPARLPGPLNLAKVAYTAVAWAAWLGFFFEWTR